MDLSKYSPETRKYISELIKRNAISPESLKDQTFINSLSFQRYDEDYIRSMVKDRD